MTLKTKTALAPVITCVHTLPTANIIWCSLKPNTVFLNYWNAFYFFIFFYEDVTLMGFSGFVVCSVILISSIFKELFSMAWISASVNNILSHLFVIVSFRVYGWTKILEEKRGDGQENWSNAKTSVRECAF